MSFSLSTSGYLEKTSGLSSKIEVYVCFCSKQVATTFSDFIMFKGFGTTFCNVLDKDLYANFSGIGYNGFPRGCSDDELPWAKVTFLLKSTLLSTFL